jgi:hypothetical protein
MHSFYLMGLNFCVHLHVLLNESKFLFTSCTANHFTKEGKEKMSDEWFKVQSVFKWTY